MTSSGLSAAIAERDWRLVAMRIYRVVAWAAGLTVMAMPLAGYLTHWVFGVMPWFVIAFFSMMPGQLFVILEINRRAKDVGRSNALQFDFWRFSLIDKILTGVAVVFALSLALFETGSPFMELGQASPTPECPTGFSNHGTFTCGTAEQFLQGQLGEQGMFVGVLGIIFCAHALLLTSMLLTDADERAHPLDLR